MEDGLLDLERKHQGHGKRIVKITIPPTGVVAVTRSTGQTVYLTELSLPPPRNDLQAAPDDTLAMPEGEPRTSGAKDRGGPQHNMRDTIVPKSATTEMPNPSPLRVSSYSVRHHGLLNSDGGCEHQTWEGRYTVGGSRQTLSTPTSSDANTEEGPTGPPKPPPSPPLPSPRLFSWSDACIQARLHPYEVDMLSRSYPAISSTARPKIRGSSNYQTYPYWQGHSLQYPPHISHQVTHNQGADMLAYQHPTSNHHSQPRPEHIPQALQSAPAPHPSIEHDSAWQRLRSDRTQWDPNAPEPHRPDGESVLMNFTSRGDHKFYCRVPTQRGYCEYLNIKKERLLHHIRKDHLNFFPFICGGGCRSQGCTLRFASDMVRKEHINPRMCMCPICGRELYTQDYSIHYAKCIQK